MKVRLTLICFFFLSLQDGNSGLADAQLLVFTGTEGGDGTVTCSFSSSGRRMFFCKEECKQQDILIETTNATAQRGRYRIKYERGNVFVTISQLTKSDSGLYRCGLDRSLSSTVYRRIEIIVVDAMLDRPEVKTLYTRTGGNIVVECSFTSSERRGYFCKEECEDKDILVETTDVRARRGRYSIRYVRGSPKGGFLFVSITQLTESDSGKYRCALDSFLSQDPYLGFEVIVTDAPTTSKPKSTLPAFSTSVPSASTPTRTQSLSSQTDQQQGETTPAAPEVWLYVVLTLGVLIFLLSLAVLIYCRKRSSKPNEPPIEMEYASVTETNRVYEDIREDRRSRSAPVDISLLARAKQNGVESSDEYSMVTAPSSQNTAKDDPSKLTYSEVDFSKRTVGSSSRALRGLEDNVVYSVPRVEASSGAGHSEDVYSTVS